MITTCPSEEINFLPLNSFQFQIDKLPEISFYVQKVNLPGLSIPAPEYNTPLSKISLPGDMIDFEALSIDFMVDDKLKNWNAIFDWIKGLGFPYDNKQYSDLLLEQPTIESNLSKTMATGMLIINDSNNTPVKTYTFYNLVPTGLTGIDFNSAITDIEYAIVTATFNYTLYQ